MNECFFVSDLHGHMDRYETLFTAIEKDVPRGVFIGGDLLPPAWDALTSLNVGHVDFINGYLVPRLTSLKTRMGPEYPDIFVILGNDDGRFQEAAVLDAATRGIWQYAHNRKLQFGKYAVYGYAYVPPTPFRLKDWERYDVSRYVDPGCTPPDEGSRSVSVPEDELKYSTIADDLNQLVLDDDLSRSILLFHTPPHKTKLDRAALDGKMIDYVPLDVHIGSIAVRRFIQARQPLISLHGHVHESTRITGSWSDMLGRTYMFNAAHDGPELSLIRFDPADPSDARRELLSP
jgi:uncharacterized protein